MIEKLKNEPVMIGLAMFVGATVALLVAFGVDVSAAQREAIEAWVFAAAVLGVAVRSLVRPMRKGLPEDAGLQSPQDWLVQERAMMYADRGWIDKDQAMAAIRENRLL